MAPKTSAKGSKASTGSRSGGAPSASPSTALPWPTLSAKPHYDREVETVLDDQIVVIRHFLHDQDVDALLAFFSKTITPLLVPSPPAKRGEAKRTNARFSTFAPEFAQHLYTATGLDRIVADWPSDPLHPKRGSQLPTPKGLLENVRVYKYLPGEFFGPHYDESVPSPVNPSFFSQWTLLIYLNEKGVPVEGGDTIFYLPGRKNEMLAVQPERGAAMLHRHGSSCMRHEGAPVLKGVKWILRSDLLYGS